MGPVTPEPMTSLDTPPAKRAYWTLLLGTAIGLAVVAASLIGWQTSQQRSPAPAQTTQRALQPPVIRPALVATGFTLPVKIAVAPGSNRLYVVEQAGTVRTMDPNGQVSANPFLDISSKVLSGGEMGLLGLAFSPKYLQDGYIYVDYVHTGQYTVVARYHAVKGKVDPASEKVLLTVQQPYTNHKGGDVTFGPDGYLYIPLGDGGSGGDPQNHAQNKNDYLGKLLRIDVNKGDPYAVPSTNPFTHSVGAKPEVWAYGLRNPWRISFDRATGDLYIADVGQGAMEEIDVQKAGSKGGENYGWRCYEGLQTYNADGCVPASQYVMPALQYDHSDKRCAITGGFVYRGSRYPGMTGKYIYGDYCSGDLFYLGKKDGKTVGVQAAKTPYNISTFGQDNSGELYMADLKTGSVYHLEDSAN